MIDDGIQGCDHFNMKDITMSDENEWAPPEPTFFVEDDGRFDAFRAGLQTLVDSTKELGPIMHICVLAEVCGYIVASQFPDQRDAMAETMLMNLDRGIAAWIASAMEASAKGSLN